MLKRLKRLISSLPIHAAHCFDRLIATQLSGFFYFLGGIIKIPWKNIYGGILPAIITLTLSIVAFIYKARQLRISSVKKQFLTVNFSDMTQSILFNLRQTTQGLPYLSSLNLSSSEIDFVLNQASDAEIDELRPILQKMFDHIESSRLRLATNLWSSTIHCLTHFHEVLLLKNYTDLELLNDYELSKTNILTLALILCATYSGYQNFRRLQRNDKNPSAHLLWKTIVSDCHLYTQQKNGSEIFDTARTVSFANNSSALLRSYWTF